MYLIELGVFTTQLKPTETDEVNPKKEIDEADHN
jgi:hypothetical protein